MTRSTIEADTDVAVDFGGRCLLGRTAKAFHGHRDDGVAVRFAGQPFLYVEPRRHVFVAGERRVGPDGTLLPAMSYARAVAQVLEQAERHVAIEPADHRTRTAVATVGAFHEAHGPAIYETWKPALSSRPEGWPARATESSDNDDTTEPVGALKAVLTLAGRMLGDSGAVAAALAHGAKLHLHEDRVGSDDAWVVLDRPGTPMFDEAYASREEAASAFCRHYGIAPEANPRRVSGAQAAELEQASDLVRELLTLHGHELAHMAVPAPSLR